MTNKSASTPSSVGPGPSCHKHQIRQSNPYVDNLPISLLILVQDSAGLSRVRQPDYTKTRIRSICLEWNSQTGQLETLGSTNARLLLHFMYSHTFSLPRKCSRVLQSMVNGSVRLQLNSFYINLKDMGHCALSDNCYRHTLRVLLLGLLGIVGSNIISQSCTIDINEEQSLKYWDKDKEWFQEGPKLRSLTLRGFETMYNI